MNATDAYRLDALLELATTYPGSLTVSEVARRRRVSAKFLARLLPGLARRSLVATARGPRGGIRLASPPQGVCLAAVLPAETPPTVGGPAVRWLATELASARQSTLASLNLADLLRIEREQASVESWEI